MRTRPDTSSLVITALALSAFAPSAFAYLDPSTGSMIITAIGWKATLVIWTPIAYLFFMIPLPDFVYKNLSAIPERYFSRVGLEKDIDIIASSQ